jgi:hypothetical protein
VGAGVGAGVVGAGVVGAGVVGAGVVGAVSITTGFPLTFEICVLLFMVPLLVMRPFTVLVMLP